MKEFQVAWNLSYGWVMGLIGFILPWLIALGTFLIVGGVISAIFTYRQEDTEEVKE